MASQFRSGDPKYGLMYELCYRSRGCGRHFTFGWKREGFRYSHRRLYHCGHSERNESDRCSELHAESGAWPGLVGRGSFGYAEKTRLETEFLIPSGKPFEPGLHDQVKLPTDPSVGGGVTDLRRGKRAFLPIGKLSGLGKSLLEENGR